MVKITGRKLLFMVLTALLVLAVGVGVASAATYTDDLCADPSKAFASSNYNNRPASKAFDDANIGYTVDAWEAQNTTLPQWVGYNFGKSTVITKYTISQPGNLTANSPKSWIFQGSNDNSSWTDLDSKTGTASWAAGEKREYAFNNLNGYQYYRLYLTGLNSGTSYAVIGEMEMMADVNPLLVAPTDLSATLNDNDVTLTWAAVTDATSYNIKRTTVDGGPYETIGTATAAEIPYQDLDLAPGTYYYVVTSVNANGESGNSNQVVVTIDNLVPPSGNGTLVVTMANGDDRTYNLAMEEIQDFMAWYANRSAGGNIYIINMGASGAYSSIKDYLVFDKIVAWKVMEY